MNDAPPPPPPPEPVPAPMPPDQPTVVLPSGVTFADPWLRFGSRLLDGLLIIVTLGIGWLIWAAIIGQTAQTPAKKMLNLRVIDVHDLRPVRMGRMFWMRGILGGIVAFFALSCTFYVLAFMPFWDRHNQNIWDKVSSTYVVTDPMDAWGINVVRAA